MFKSFMIENPNELICSQNHNLPVHMILYEKNVDQKKRLLCPLCIDQVDTVQNKIIDFKQSIKMIEENQKRKMKLYEIIYSKNKKNIESFQNSLHLLKDYIVFQLDGLLVQSNEWIQTLEDIIKKYQNYSYYDELENLLQNQQDGQLNLKQLNIEIRENNQSQHFKIKNKWHQLKDFENSKEYQDVLQLIQNFENPRVKYELQIYNQQQQEKSIEITKKQKQSQIKLQLINSIRQESKCFFMSFNYNDTLLATIKGKIIQIWQFEQGEMKKIMYQIEYTKMISCLIFSKYNNILISGFEDGTIQIWKENNQLVQTQSEFKHQNHINCIRINKAENQLITGSKDSLIIIWKIDLNLQKKEHQQTLQQHKETVVDISLSPSETILASTSNDKQLIIWKFGENKEWIFNYVINFSIQQVVTRLCFIKENQLISVSTKNQFIVYEIENDKFKEKQQKTIQLDKSSQIDMNLFPICLNKEQNIIVVKNKTRIYIIREELNENFKIYGEIECKSNFIFGSLSQDGRFIVFWDENDKNFNVYELCILL